MENEQIERIEKYVKTFNKLAGEDDDLLRYSVETVVDRALLYLNHETLEKRFERILADVVSGVFTKYRRNADSDEPDTAIASMSDNGQSVSFHNEVRNYLATSEDSELFGGFAKLLMPYRRVKVVYSEKRKKGTFSHFL